MPAPEGATSHDAKVRLQDRPRDSQFCSRKIIGAGVLTKECTFKNVQESRTALLDAFAVSLGTIDIGAPMVRAWSFWEGDKLIIKLMDTCRPSISC